MEVAFVPPVTDMPRRAHVGSLQPMPDGRYLVAFDAVADRDTAEALVGCFCLVRREDLPDDLGPEPEQGVEGFAVVDDSYGPLGTVREAVDNGAQSVLVVAGPYGEVMVPYVREIVYGEDAGLRQLRTCVPQGLVELGAEPGGRPEADGGHADAEGRPEEGGAL